LTDVDDKIIKKCTELNQSLVDITRHYEEKFMDDLQALNILPARVYPRATEHIEEMVQMILDLKENGLAYQSEEGSWYFQVGKKEGYGQQLVSLDVANLKKNASGWAGAQRNNKSDNDHDNDDHDINADEYYADKVGVRDFALWKAYKPNFDREDATWDTRIGKGRPGWHLECSAMAKKYLGKSIDIHCGGIDLKFPHHENEIAQSEGANQQKFCSCWLHNGFVNIGDEKMSKSKGNFLTLRTACPTKDDVRAYRYLVVSSQYRNPLSFTEAAMGAAKGALKRMDNVMKQIDEALEGYGGKDTPHEESDMTKIVAQELDNFEQSLLDDLSTPRAAASLFAVIKVAEAEFKRYKKEEKDGEPESPLDIVGLSAVKSALEQMDKVFGVFYDVPNAKNEDGTEVAEANDSDVDSVPDEVMILVQSRTAAKEAKDWELADSLRNQISELGYSVKDVKGGDPIVSRQ
jgi:cysteinyl-tRNA synthetase